MERPEQPSSNPFGRLFRDAASEFRARGQFPPGELDFNFSRSMQMVDDPLPILLPLYEKYGPIYSLRILHQPHVFMIGPEANHFVTVAHPEHFHWREGSFGDLIPLLGDGLLTIDGGYHDRARRIIMPAFHREQIEASVAAMVEETERAMEGWKVGDTIDLYEWMRRLAMRIAMRALLGLDPDDGGSGKLASAQFERALSFYCVDFHKRFLRGPGSPFRRLIDARKALDVIVYAEIAKRRSQPTGERMDILSLLIEARDEDGSGLTDHEIRDQVMTLMFAGHDTSTSTVTFMTYELARHPAELEKLVAEQDDVLGDRRPTAAELERGLPIFEMALDETLRLYPPAWIGPRRVVKEFEFGGHHVPVDAYVSYCSWASHRLPEVFPDPDAFIPERFTKERKAALPRGAYVPFGAGSRICIGKRFGQTEVRTVMSMILQRFRPELVPGRTMRIRQMPTLSPVDGLPVVLRERR